jgi:hypothetical protein
MLLSVWNVEFQDLGLSSEFERKECFVVAARQPVDPPQFAHPIRPQSRVLVPDT